MATQTLEFTAATGLTITCKLFAVGSDTLVASATAAANVITQLNLPLSRMRDLGLITS